MKPNIILINLDDADAEMFLRSDAPRYFPKMLRSVARKGVVFDNCHVTTPLCGPSRASLYRGQYAFNTGVKVNDPKALESNQFGGGFKFYREQGFFEDDLPVWMKAAGYRTMLVGKFLHHDFEPIVPKGWDDFYSSLGARYYRTYRFTNRQNPEGEFEIIPPDVYRTTAESEDAIALIENHVAGSNSGQPFFLNINPIGPHLGSSEDPAMYEHRYRNRWRNLTVPRSETINELDFSDKRGPYRDFGPLPEWVIQLGQTHNRERILAVKSIDDMVGEIVDTLRRLDIDQETYIFITSDNGFSLGHHRSWGKGTPTNRSTNVPLIVMGPGVARNRVAHHLIGHIDLAPTIVELGGGQIPDFVDGISFAGLLQSPDSISVHTHRPYLMIENWQSLYVNDFSRPADFAATTLRLVDEVYTEWANGDRDYFDLVEDPEQLQNRYDSLNEIQRSFLFEAIRLIRSGTSVKAKAKYRVPFSRDLVLEDKTLLTGYAEDAVSVRRVRLAFQDAETGLWWNGKDWQPKFVPIGAQVDNRGGLISTWSYRLHFRDKAPRGKCYSWLWAFDEKFRHEPPELAIFSINQP